MAAARVLILGGGFGGLSAAHTVRAEAGESVDVTVVDRSPTFMMGLRKLWFLDGRTTRGEGERARSGLERAGIRFRQGTVEAIDPAGHEVRVDGEALAFDFLVVALGAQARPDLVPGEKDGNPNLFSVDGAEASGRRLADLERGRVIVAVAGVPYKCPPAAYEAAFLVDDVLRRAGRRDNVAIDVLTPQPMSIPAAGPVACAHVEGRLGTRNIGFHPNAKLERLDPGRAVLAGGEAMEAELLMVVPPHRPPQVVADAGLIPKGEWVTVDSRTLATGHDRVFAIGDVVAMETGGGLPFPKAGVFAEQHGQVVGRNIAALVGGGEPADTFDGVGLCFLEIGGGEASFVSGNFLASPPEVTIADPSPEHLESKIAFERERLDRWLPEG